MLFEHQRDSFVRLLGRGRAHGRLSTPSKISKHVSSLLFLSERETNFCPVQLFCQIMRACDSPD